MTKWADSLIRISNHEVETLQKRLADIVERRQTAEMKVAALDAQSEAEAMQAQGDVEAGWYMIGFRQGS
ncbi:MAG: flagellar export protein FliJ, partial [Caulobacter sp.]|nr:flagellar export protein FliJ [Caulobacter sp.]